MTARVLSPVLLLLLVRCASGVADTSAPKAVAEVEPFSLSPAAGSEVTAETVLVAQIR